MPEPPLPRPKPPLWLQALILSGGAPFIACALGAALGPPDVAAWSARAMAAYAATVIGFLGGVRWGAAITGAAALRPHTLILAAGAPTLSWGALLLDQPRGALLVLAATGLALLWWDLRAIREGLLPAWLRPLRIALTLTAVACMAVGIAAG